MVRISDVEKPTVKDHEVLVKVHATTVNRTDCGFRAAKPFIVRFFTGLLRPRVTVLGSEFAGVVEAVGSGVTSFTAGDRVFGFSEGRFGAHAEYLSSDVGPLSQNPLLALVTPLFGGRKVMFPIPPKHDQDGVRQFRDLIESGKFTPVIDRRYPLDQIVEAYRYVETGQKIGNVVISVDPGV